MKSLLAEGNLFWKFSWFTDEYFVPMSKKKKKAFLSLPLILGITQELYGEGAWQVRLRCLEHCPAPQELWVRSLVQVRMIPRLVQMRGNHRYFSHIDVSLPPFFSL